MSGIFEDVQIACAHLSSVPVSHAMPLCRISTGKSKEVSLLSGALCCCPACECKCGLPIWYLGLVVMFSLTGSSSGMLHGLAAAVLAHGISQLPLSTCYCSVQRLFVAANDLLQRLLREVKHCPIVDFVILAWETAFDSFTA